MTTMPSTLLRLAAALGFCLGLTAHAQTDTMPRAAPDLQNVAHMAASATVEVTKDVLTVTFSTTRDGPDAQVVQSGLKQALDGALAEAKKAAKPGQVDVQTGGFSLYPRHNPKGGGISGWSGSAELIVSGKDMPSVAQLTGRIQTMTIARVSQDLSRDTRERAEADATEKAVARFRARAGDLAKQFGFGAFTVREVHVNLNEPVHPMPMAQSRSVGMAAEMTLPTEAGKGHVTATVNGSIQMK